MRSHIFLLGVLFILPPSLPLQVPPPPPTSEGGWVLVTTLVGNVDEDPEPEYLVLLRKAAREGDDGLRIRFFDFDAQTRTWTPTEITNESQESESRLFPSETTVTLEDVTRDGRMEIVIRLRRTARPSDEAEGLMILTKRGRYLHQLFAAWEGAPILRDLDGDGIKEIVLHAEYTGPTGTEPPVLYPAQVFAYADGVFRRTPLRRYAGYLAERTSAARTEYEALKRQLSRQPMSARDHPTLFCAAAQILLVLRAQEDWEGMRAYYQAERPWLRTRLSPAYLHALDELITPAMLRKK